MKNSQRKLLIFSIFSAVILFSFSCSKYEQFSMSSSIASLELDDGVVLYFRQTCNNDIKPDGAVLIISTNSMRFFTQYVNENGKLNFSFQDDLNIPGENYLVRSEIYFIGPDKKLLMIQREIMCENILDRLEMVQSEIEKSGEINESLHKLLISAFERKASE